MSQYQAIKSKYPDCLLFFRLGDFYELFGDDAKKAAKELDIVLTSRGAGKEQKVPMCGVPYHAVENYLNRLLEKGYKVAICEQLEEAKPGKGIVKRDVVRVVTPGTILNAAYLDQANNGNITLYGISAMCRQQSRGFPGFIMFISNYFFIMLQTFFQKFWQSVEIARSKNDINKGCLFHQELSNLRIVGHTPPNRNDKFGVFAFLIFHIPQKPQCSLFSGFSDRAGIENDDIRILRVRGPLITLFF